MPVIKHDQDNNKSLDQTVAKFNSTALQTANDAKIEHGSLQYAGAPKFDKNCRDYGRPLVGTKSQARGVRGGEHVMREVIFLCEMIEQNGEGTPPDCYMKFGPLFYMYSRISETLVGMLIRARKYGLIDFEGEMLYQRQDDHKKIRLLMSSVEINQSIEYTGDPGNIIKFNNGKMVPPPAPRAQLMPNAAPPPVFSLGPSKKVVPPAVVPRKPVPSPQATKNETVPNSNRQTAPNSKVPNGQTAPISNGQTVAKEMPKSAVPSKTTHPTMKTGNNKAAAAAPVFCVHLPGNKSRND